MSREGLEESGIRCIENGRKVEQVVRNQLNPVLFERIT